MTARYAGVLAVVACAAPAPAPPRAAPEPELVGVWGSEQVFVPGPAGALEVTPGAGGWRATLGGATATLQLVDGWWRGDVGDGELRLRPAAATAATIDGRDPPTGSAAEGRRGSIDGRDPPTGSAAEGRRGSIDGRGPPTGSAAEGRRGSIDA